MMDNMMMNLLFSPCDKLECAVLDGAIIGRSPWNLGTIPLTGTVLSKMDRTAPEKAAGYKSKNNKPRQQLEMTENRGALIVDSGSLAAIACHLPILPRLGTFFSYHHARTGPAALPSLGNGDMARNDRWPPA